MADIPHEPIQPITEASAPFDDTDADVILRSSDNVDFRVYKVFLSVGSPFFKDMFSLPQAATSAADKSSETKDGLPVVQMSETAVILRMLLCMCYPMGAVEQPALDKLEEVDLLLDATMKYSVERVEKRVREALISPKCMRGNEARAFAIACRHRLDAEAKAAARAALEVPMLEMESGPELDFLSAARFFRLIKYHANCVKAAREAVADFSSGATTATAAMTATTANTLQYCIHCAHRYYSNQVPAQPKLTLNHLSKALLLRLPSRADIETAMEANGSPLSVNCPSCSRPTVKTGNAGPNFKSLREAMDLYSAKLEDAVSSVSP